MNDEDLIEVERGVDVTAEPFATATVPARDGVSADSPLSEHARSRAAEWVLGDRILGSAALHARLERAMEVIGEAAKRMSAEDDAEGLLSVDDRDFLNNVRLMRAAALEVREMLKVEIPIRQLKLATDSIIEFPRPYVAARAHLSVAKALFDEDVFAEYMQAFEEKSFFEMHEIWALKPAMQMVVVECLAAKVRTSAAVAEEVLPIDGDFAVADIAFGTLIKSLHRLSHTHLKESFPLLSRTHTTLLQDPIDAYRHMDFDSCDLYRNTIQQLARSSDADEFEIARLAVEFSRQAVTQKHPNDRARDRRCHVGFYLIDRGQKLMKQHIGYKPRGAGAFTETFRDSPEAFYFLTLELLVFAMMFFVVTSVSGTVPIIAAALLLILPASEAAVEVVNQLVTFLTPVRALPRLDFSRGIPEDCLTIVAVPTLLIDEEQIRDLVRSLEIRYIGNNDPHLYYALLTDPPDSEQRFDERDQFVSLCSGLIEGLNKKYGRSGCGPFLHFHRHRVFNEIENKWMGWERKRGKLLDFNDFLRGQYDRFPVKVGDLSILQRVRYVITLDSDTQLPREAGHRLVSTLAHPLNRASVNPVTKTVDEGYGVLQPRVGISVQSANRSRLAYIYSGQTGLDIYARAVSDVYQDLFGEGIFTGKGIYEVDVFREVLAGRFPSNAILSHDLIEGAYARAGLASDVEIIDDYPSHFSAHSRRKHRWIRGDWQILRWLFPRVPDAQGKLVKNPLDVVSRWKILDNLRRSVIEAATFVLFLAAWFYLPGTPAAWTAATVALMLVPSYAQLVLSLARVWRSNDRAGIVRQSFSDFTSGQITVLTTLTFLAHQTLMTLDAIFRTVFRLTVSRRNLLEWETAAQSEMDTKKARTPADVYMGWAPIVAVTIAIAESIFRPQALLASLPILGLWMLARPVAQWLDRPLHSVRSDIGEAEEDFLRVCALKTWRYFRELSNEHSNWLVPDNVTEEPLSIAHRLSPTNLGLQLNAQFAAYDLGFLDTISYLDAIEKTLGSAKRLPRFRGHFLNWFDTVTLQALDPRFVSSVDSGNLACSLWCVKQGCADIAKRPIFRAVSLRVIREHLGIFAEQCGLAAEGSEAHSKGQKLQTEVAALGDKPAAWFAALRDIDESLGEISGRLPHVESSQAAASAHWWLAASRARIRDLHELVSGLMPWMLPEYAAVRNQVGEMLYGDVTTGLTLQEISGFVGKLQKKLEEYSFWTEEHGALQELRGRLPKCSSRADELLGRLAQIAQDADVLVHQMDFKFLYNPKRKMLSVGFDVGRNEQLESCYDLLASEARSAVFVAIAKGDIPQNSWFQLGRVHTHVDKRSILQSWTGTMFEYLMPMLWMKAYPETLLENSMGAAVFVQRAVIDKLGIPWGISEGASSVRNEAGHYDYHAFGIRALALKTDVPKRLVITPYAAFLALNVDPANSVRNLREMQAQKWVGPLGFYESADYGRPKRGETLKPVVVRSWMAHHQGMSLLSVANLLSDSVFQRLFHEEVMVASTERILHERKPSTTNSDTAELGSGEWILP
jgi:cyclic beta-1,2-glucan synthetase